MNLIIDSFKVELDDLFKYNFVNIKYTDSFSKEEKYSHM